MSVYTGYLTPDINRQDAVRIAGKLRVGGETLVNLIPRVEIWPGSKRGQFRVYVHDAASQDIYAWLRRVGLDLKIPGVNPASRNPANFKIGDAVLTPKKDFGRIDSSQFYQHSGATLHYVRVGHHMEMIDDDDLKPAPPVKKTASKNPGRAPTLIYGRVDKIFAIKTQPHACDAGCKRNGHRYVHTFEAPVQMYGLDSGEILLSTRKR